MQCSSTGKICFLALTAYCCKSPGTWSHMDDKSCSLHRLPTRDMGRLYIYMARYAPPLTSFTTGHFSRAFSLCKLNSEGDIQLPRSAGSPPDVQATRLPTGKANAKQSVLVLYCETRRRLRLKRTSHHHLPIGT